MENFKILDFIKKIYIFWKNWNFSWGVKIKRNPKKLFWSALNFMSINVFRLRFTSNLYILEAFEHFAAFWPKMVKDDATKTRFLSNLWTATVVRDVKLMPNKVIKDLRWYLLLFLSYRENTGKGGQYLSPRAARSRLTHLYNREWCNNFIFLCSRCWFPIRTTMEECFYLALCRDARITTS